MTPPLARAAKRLLLGAGVALLIVVATPSVASAHPLGNFTTNSFSGIQVEPTAVAIHMVVDFAEIPTVEQLPDANRPGGVPAAQATAYAAQECKKLLPGIHLTISRSQQPLAIKSSNLGVFNGAAGLHTMHLTCELHTTSPLTTVGQTLRYVDQNSLTRVGWREITAVGDGVDLAHSDVPVRSVSGELTHYPTALLSSPLDQRSASMQVEVGSGTVIGQSNPNQPTATSAAHSSAGLGGLTAAFTNLVSAQRLSVGFALLALLISIVLGALHAFAPGHGKTLMAAYLLGRRSSLRQVAIIGLTVTLTHTAGVLVLGVVLSAVVLTAPALIYSWLGIASGAMLVAIGASLLRRSPARSHPPTTEQRVEALVGAAQPSHHHENAHDHSHAHGHGHDHHHEEGHREVELTHTHGFGGAHTHPSPQAGARKMIAVGFAGGMVPSPSALVVLLGGIALGRTWFGVLLVVGYGLGMAAALIGTGMALAYARDRVERWTARRPAPRGRPSTLTRAISVLPTLTAILVMLVGVSVILRSSLTL